MLAPTSPDAPRVAAALAGGALALAHAGTAGAWWGAGAAPLWTAVLLLVAALLGAAVRRARDVSWAGALAGGLGALVLLVIAVGRGPAAVLAPLGTVAAAATLLGLGGVGGQVLARAAVACGERRVTALAFAAAALATVVAGLPATLGTAGPTTDAVLAPIALCLLLLARRRSSAAEADRSATVEPAASGRPWIEPLAAVVSGAAAGFAGGVAAAGLGQTSTTAIAAATAAAAALGVFLGGRARGRWRLDVAGAVVSSALVAALLLGQFVRLGAAGALLPLAALTGLAAGAALALSHRPGGAAPLLGPLAATACAAAAVLPGAQRAIASLDEPDRVALALAQPLPAPTSLRDALGAGRVRARFVASGPPLVAVIDVLDRDRAARLLSAGGRTLGSVPIGGVDAAPRPPNAPPAPSGASLLTVSIVEGALPHLVASWPVRRIAVVGLETGVAAGVALLDSAVETLDVVEPTAGVVAAHRDPGDLFGASSGRPLEDPRTRLHEGPAWPFLRAGGRFDAVLGGAPARVADAEVARRAGALVVVRLEPASPWDLRPRLAALLPELGADVYAFWPRREAGLVLVAGAGRLAPQRVAARWAQAGALRERLERLGLHRPEEVVGLCIAGPAGLEAFAHDPGAGGDPLELLRRAAPLLPGDLALPEDPAVRADLLVRLAEEAGRRKAATTLPLAQEALKAARTPETLRVLGDVLLQEGREDEALLRWNEALSVEPAAIAPRLSIALLHQRRGEGEEARALLEGALVGDPAKDAPVRYVLGALAMVEEDHARAKEHFLAAGSLGDAPDRALLASELLRRASKPGDRKLSPEQRLELARRHLERVEAALLEGDEVTAERAQGAAVSPLLDLSIDPTGLSRDARLELGRLLSRAAATEPLAPARDHLHRLAADALEPFDDDPAVAVERAIALHLGDRGPQAEALLVETIRGAGERLPRVHVALGDVLAAQGRGDAAIASYERALALGAASSTDATIYLQIAGLERAARRPDRAVRALEAADRAAPGHPDVLANLGTLYKELGRDGDARSAWERFLAVAPPGHPLRERIEAALKRLRRS